MGKARPQQNRKCRRKDRREKIPTPGLPSVDKTNRYYWNMLDDIYEITKNNPIWSHRNAQHAVEQAVMAMACSHKDLIPKLAGYRFDKTNNLQMPVKIYELQPTNTRPNQKSGPRWKRYASRSYLVVSRSAQQTVLTAHCPA